MPTSETHFEQVPIATIKKIIEKNPPEILGLVKATKIAKLKSASEVTATPRDSKK